MWSFCTRRSSALGTRCQHGLRKFSGSWVSLGEDGCAANAKNSMINDENNRAQFQSLKKYNKWKWYMHLCLNILQGMNHFTNAFQKYSQHLNNLKLCHVTATNLHEILTFYVKNQYKVVLNSKVKVKIISQSSQIKIHFTKVCCAYVFSTLYSHTPNKIAQHQLLSEVT